MQTPIPEVSSNLKRFLDPGAIDRTALITGCFPILAFDEASHPPRQTSQPFQTSLNAFPRIRLPLPAHDPGESLRGSFLGQDSFQTLFASDLEHPNSPKLLREDIQLYMPFFQYIGHRCRIHESFQPRIISRFDHRDITPVREDPTSFKMSPAQPGAPAGSKRLRSDSPTPGGSALSTRGRGKRLCDESREGRVITCVVRDSVAQDTPPTPQKGRKQRPSRNLGTRTGYGESSPRYSLRSSKRMPDNKARDRALPIEPQESIGRAAEMRDGAHEHDHRWSNGRSDKAYSMANATQSMDGIEPVRNHNPEGLEYATVDNQPTGNVVSQDQLANDAPGSRPSGGEWAVQPKHDDSLNSMHFTDVRQTECLRKLDSVSSVASSSRSLVFSDISDTHPHAVEVPHRLHTTRGGVHPLVRSSVVRKSVSFAASLSKEHSLSFDNVAGSSESEVLSPVAMSGKTPINQLQADQHPRDGQPSTAGPTTILPTVPPSSAYLSQVPRDLLRQQSSSVASDSLGASSRSGVISDASMSDEAMADGLRVGPPQQPRSEQRSAFAGAGPTTLFPTASTFAPHFAQVPRDPPRQQSSSVDSDSLGASSRSGVLSDASMADEAMADGRRVGLPQQSRSAQPPACAGTSTGPPMISPAAPTTFVSEFAQVAPEPQLQHSFSVSSLAASSWSEVLSDVSMAGEATGGQHAGSSREPPGRRGSEINFGSPVYRPSSPHRLTTDSTHPLTLPAPFPTRFNNLRNPEECLSRDAVSEASMNDLAKNLSAVQIVQQPLNVSSPIIATPFSGPCPPAFESRFPILESTSSLGQSASLASLALSSRTAIVSEVSTEYVMQDVMADERRLKTPRPSHQGVPNSIFTSIECSAPPAVYPADRRRPDQHEHSFRQAYVQKWVTALPSPAAPMNATPTPSVQALSQPPVRQQVADPRSNSDANSARSDRHTFSSGRLTWDEAQSVIRRSQWQYPAFPPPLFPQVSGLRDPASSAEGFRVVRNSSVEGHAHDAAPTGIHNASSHGVADPGFAMDDGPHDGRAIIGRSPDAGFPAQGHRDPGTFPPAFSGSHNPPIPPLRMQDSQDDLVSLRGTDSAVTMDVDVLTDDDATDIVPHSPLSQRLVLSDNSGSVHDTPVSKTNEQQHALPTASSSRTSAGNSDVEMPRFSSQSCFKGSTKSPTETTRLKQLPDNLRVIELLLFSQSSSFFQNKGIHCKEPQKAQCQNAKEPDAGFHREGRSRAYPWKCMGTGEKNTSPITSVILSCIERWVASERVERYGPNSNNFQLFLDFNHVPHDMRPHCNAWNNQAKEVFADDFIASYPDYRLHRDTILDCFSTHLKQLRSQFKKQYSIMDETTRASAVKARKEQLRRSLCGRRLKILSIFLKGKGRAMERLLKAALETLDWRCCSGNETDEDGDHAITRLPWRYDPADKDPEAEAKEDPYRSAAVPGLPENFYDSAWRQKIGEVRDQSLNKKRPVSLQLPEELIRLAETALPVRNRNTQPLERWNDAERLVARGANAAGFISEFLEASAGTVRDHELVFPHNTLYPVRALLSVQEGRGARPTEKRRIYPVPSAVRTQGQRSVIVQQTVGRREAMFVLHPTSRCDVCLEAFGSEGEMVPYAIPCGHVFCKTCLESVQTMKCPMCRKPYDPQRLKKLHVDLPDGLEDPREADLLHRVVSSFESTEDIWRALLTEVDAYLTDKAEDAAEPLRKAREALSKHHEAREKVVRGKREIHHLRREIREKDETGKADKERFVAIEKSLLARADELQTLLVTAQGEIEHLRAEIQRRTQLKNPLPAPPQPISLDRYAGFGNANGPQAWYSDNGQSMLPARGHSSIGVSVIHPRNLYGDDNRENNPRVLSDSNGVRQDRKGKSRERTARLNNLCLRPWCPTLSSSHETSKPKAGIIPGASPKSKFVPPDPDAELERGLPCVQASRSRKRG
ncbi:hypothetical protein NMY22_g4546 [Coprinellus aureogranulatus]|nr:hypothetical protein NMY22_g4546 [Coprinellus aureogranulatus]